MPSLKITPQSGIAELSWAPPFVVIAVERLIAQLVLAAVKEVVLHASGGLDQGNGIRRIVVGQI